jgi:hypothetical protein
MNHSAWRTPFVLALSLTSGLGLALGTECPVGVNVNSFQNFSAAEQQMIVEQLKSCGVSFVRTSLREREALLADGMGILQCRHVFGRRPDPSPFSRRDARLFPPPFPTGTPGRLLLVCVERAGSGLHLSRRSPDGGR